MMSGVYLMAMSIFGFFMSPAYSGSLQKRPAVPLPGGPIAGLEVSNLTYHVPSLAAPPPDPPLVTPLSLSTPPIRDPQPLSAVTTMTGEDHPPDASITASLPVEPKTNPQSHITSGDRIPDASLTAPPSSPSGCTLYSPCNLFFQV